MKDLLNPQTWRILPQQSPSAGRRRWQEEQRRKKVRALMLFGLLCLAVAAAGIVFAIRNIAPPATPLEVAGKTITVRRGGNFQLALNQAQAGDTIILEAGASFVGSFELPSKTGAEFITIQSSNLSQLPAEGVRVSPKDAAAMPKILSRGKGASAVYTAPSAHHYRFVGIEFSGSNDDYIYNLIALGTDDQKAEQMPRFFEFDRCYIHSKGLNKIRRGFALNSADTIIKNSYVAGFAGAQDETQAIAGWNGAGRYKILNNHLEGGAENILFGGADPSIKNLVPTDIEIRGNLLTKPEAWRGRVTIKNVLELKNARKVQIVGNILENCFECDAFLLTVRNQDGKAPWSTVEDVEFSRNLIRNVGGGVNILGKDDTHTSERLKRARIVNNLFDSISHSDGGYFLKLADGEDVEFSHNTIFHTGLMMALHRAPTTRFSFRYNILSYNDYGVHGDEVGVGAAGAFARYFPGGTVIGNVVVNGKNIPENEFVFIPRNFLIPNFNAVGFTDRERKNYRLAPASKFKGKAENGRDIGANIDEINAAVGAK